MPQRTWVHIRGRLRALLLEKLRLATVDEQVSAQFITDALEDVENEVRGGQVRVEEVSDGGPAGQPLEAEAPAASGVSLLREARWVACAIPQV